MILGKMLWPMLGEFMAKKSINDVTSAQVSQYINDSKLINFKLKDYKYSESHYKGNLFYKGQLFAPYKIRTNYTFYDSNYKKYFVVEMFNFPGVTPYDDLLTIAKNRPVKCAINTYELSSTSYGSENNPVPIFKLILKDDSLWKESEKDCADVIKSSNTYYETAVRYNLIYYVPKADYQKMFPDHK